MNDEKELWLNSNWNFFETNKRYRKKMMWKKHTEDVRTVLVLLIEYLYNYKTFKVLIKYFSYNQ